jgi:POLQ-like helicase
MDAAASQHTSSIVAPYFLAASEEGRLDELVEVLCRAAYRDGSPRELLFADVSAAIARKRREYSTWFSLPRYSGQPVAAWRDAIQKSTFVRELWPAQRLLGENRILQGRSGVVQMPTSAGKTRATELVIRSEFLAGRAELAVIVPSPANPGRDFFVGA